VRSILFKSLSLTLTFLLFISALLGCATPAQSTNQSTSVVVQSRITNPQPEATPNNTLPSPTPTQQTTSKPLLPTITPTTSAPTSSEALTTTPTTIAPLPTTPATTPASTASQQVSVEVKVIKVLDGDTIEVEINGVPTRVRYIGIDAPEVSSPAEPFGKEASDFNRSMVEGKTVRLEKDISEVDKYDRLLRYVYTGDVFVNAELVRVGLATAWAYPPDTKYQQILEGAQAEAKSAKRGIWVPLSLQITSVTSPVNRGASAILNAKTSPGANCSIIVNYKSGPSSASGLEPKNADISGNVSWTWKVSTSTASGSWNIEVNATLGEQTATQKTSFTVR